MVARGRRTNGRLTTASDTAGSHWQPDSFSGNRRCSEVRRKKRQNAIKQVRATWLFYSQLSADSMHEWFTASSFKERNLSELKAKKLHVQNRMSDVICRVRRASIVSCSPVNAGDSFHAMFPFSDHLILAQCAQKHKSFSLMLLLLVPIGWVGAGGRVTKGY